MNSRIAAELLYESEATLRMVDDALDELRLADADPHPGPPRLTVIRGDDDDADAQGVLSTRVFWQLQEALDSVRESREMVQAMSRTTSTLRPDVDHALTLLDRLDDTSVEEAEEPALRAELRRQLIAILNRSAPADRASELTAVTNHLAECETRLARLATLFGE